MEKIENIVGQMETQNQLKLVIFETKRWTIYIVSLFNQEWIGKSWIDYSLFHFRPHLFFSFLICYTNYYIEWQYCVVCIFLFPKVLRFHNNNYIITTCITAIPIDCWKIRTEIYLVQPLLKFFQHNSFSGSSSSMRHCSITIDQKKERKMNRIK